MLADPRTWYLTVVESIQLSEFFRNVSSWPKTPAELTMASEKLAELLKAPLAAIFSADNGERIGVKSPNSSDVLQEFLKTQARHADVGTAQVKQIQVSAENAVPLANGAIINHLAVAGIAADVRVDSATRTGKGHKQLGYVLVGASKALTSKEEVILMAVSQHLSSLASIAQLEAVIQLRGQFLSIASHELKTPLTSIYGILQLQERMLRLKRDENPVLQQERQHSFLKMVIRQVERLNELIDGLLDLSRIQNGRFMVEPTETDVAALLNDVASARLSVIAQEAGVKLHIDAPPKLVAWVDPVRMEEVINNLIMNAIRFSPEGGVVWIRLREDGDSFRFTVRDQGPSLPIEDRERIFQPFERAQRTARLGGLGLGLFISRQIGQLHGGNVNLIESVPGKGNVFEAHMPLRGAAAISA